jgi:hypothetical protein
MGFMELLGVAVGLVVLAIGGFIALPRLRRTNKAKRPDARPMDTREFTTTSGGRTAFGRLSTIR